MFTHTASLLGSWQWQSWKETPSSSCPLLCWWQVLSTHERKVVHFCWAICGFMFYQSKWQSDIGLYINDASPTPLCIGCTVDSGSISGTEDHMQMVQQIAHIGTAARIRHWSECCLFTVTNQLDIERVKSNAAGVQDWSVGWCLQSNLCTINVTVHHGEVYQPCEICYLTRGRMKYV